MKRYVAKFLKDSKRTLRPGVTAADRHTLARAAFGYWRKEVRSRPSYSVAAPVRYPRVTRSKQTLRNRLRHLSRISNG